EVNDAHAAASELALNHVAPDSPVREADVSHGDLCRGFRAAKIEAVGLEQGSDLCAHGRIGTCALEVSAALGGRMLQRSGIELPDQACVVVVGHPRSLGSYPGSAICDS